MSIKHKIKRQAAAVAIAVPLALGGSAVIGTATATAAEAATWLPQKSKVKQPVGWGSTCAWVKHRYWWGGSFTMEHRWLTTSVGTQTCAAYRVW